MSRQHKKLGGTDAAAILGLNPFKTRIDVWRGLVEGYEVPQTFPMRRGVLMEPVVRTMYQEATGYELLGPRLVEPKRYPYFAGSLDDVAMVAGVERVVEFKTANIRQAHLWGDGEDEIPSQHLCQVHFYLMLTELKIADVGVFLGGDEFHVYTVPADSEFQGMMAEECERFWVDFIATKRPPPPDASENYSDWLKSRFPVPSSPMLIADKEAELLVADLHFARTARELSEKNEALARNALMLKIGEAEGMRGNGWTISYKQNKGRASTDWDGIAAETGIPKSIIEKYTKRTPYRVFKPSFKGVSNE